MATIVGNLVTQLRQRMHGLLTSPRAEMSRWQKMTRYSIELGRHCYRQLIEDRANQMAAALTYHTLFSLIPTLVLMLVVGKLFVSAGDLEQYKDQTVEHVLKWLNQSSAAMAAGAEAESQGNEAEFAQTAAALSDQIDGWLDDLQSINFGAIGAVGVLLFIYGATGLVTTIERSFNRIFDAPGNRPFLTRLPLYYTVITLGPLMLALGQYLQNMLLGWFYSGVSTFTETLDGTMVPDSGVSWLGNAAINIVVVLSPLVSTWLVLTAIYLFLPNTKVRLRPALIGGFVASIGIVLAIELFGMYVRGAAVTKLYGPLSLMPLFLLWLYVLWIVVLFGLEVTHALQTLPSERMKMRGRKDDKELVIDPRWAVPAMSVAAKAFIEGGKVTADQVAGACALPPRATHRLMGHLEQEGLLNKLGGGEQSVSYTLAKPAEHIDLLDILAAARRMAGKTAEDSTVPGGDLVRAMDDAEAKSLSGKSLADQLERDREEG